MYGLLDCFDKLTSESLPPPTIPESVPRIPDFDFELWSTSTQVSAAFSQKRPAVCLAEGAIKKGTEAYSAILSFSSYSNTSKLYSLRINKESF